MKAKEALKNGTYRKVLKFRSCPTRKQLIEQIRIEWLANRLYSILYVMQNKEHIMDIKMFRIQYLEHTYIMVKTMYQYRLEIIQTKPMENVPEYCSKMNYLYKDGINM